MTDKKTYAEKTFILQHGSPKTVSGILDSTDFRLSANPHVNRDNYTAIRHASMNQHLPSDMQSRLIKHAVDGNMPLDEIVANVSGNKNYPPETVHYMKHVADGYGDDVLYAFSKNPHLKPEHIADVLSAYSSTRKDSRKWFVDNLVNHKNVTPEAIYRASKNPDYKTSVSAIDGYEHHTPETIRHLWDMHKHALDQKHSDIVRWAIVKNKSVPYDVVKEASKHPESFLKIGLNRSMLTDDDVRHIAQNDPDEDIRSMYSKELEKRKNQE
jgi:hypothetical protein